MKRTPHTKLGHWLSCSENDRHLSQEKKEKEDENEEKLKNSFQEPALKQKRAPGEPSEKDLGNGDILLIIRYPFPVCHSVHF